MFDHAPLFLGHRKLDERRRFKLGLVVNRGQNPVWVRDIVEYLLGVPQFDISVRESNEPKHVPLAPSWLADRLYTASRRKYDAFAETEDGAVINSPPDTGEPVDALFWLASARPRGTCAGLARFGVFTLQLGDETTDPPYWREVIEASPISAAVLYWHATSFERGRAVYTAETGTQQDWAFTRNAEEPLQALPRMLAITALELMCSGSEWIAGALELPEVERPRSRQASFPSALDTLRFIARQATRSASVRVNGRGKLRRWFLALRRNPSLFYSNLGRFSRDGLEDIPLRGTHMADPFVIEHGKRNWLFYEYVPLGASRGRLSCMELDADGKPGSAQVVLKTDYHLSYPCVFNVNGEYFMIPESSANRTVQLYRATRFPFEFQLESILIDSISAVDTTPFHLNGHWYFFTTTTQPFLETFLFWSDSLDGEWRLHPISPISSSARNTRSAGHLFYHNGRLLRPTQDCSVRYGYGMTINEITRLSPTDFEEHKVDFIPPRWRRGLLGTHTLNSNTQFEVIDGIRYQ